MATTMPTIAPVLRPLLVWIAPFWPGRAPAPPLLGGLEDWPGGTTLTDGRGVVPLLPLLPLPLPFPAVLVVMAGAEDDVDEDEEEELLVVAGGGGAGGGGDDVAEVVAGAGGGGVSVVAGVVTVVC